MTIKEILSKYETDKVNGHTYGDSYEDIFSWFERDGKLNILEVGTQKGGSLLAWKDYFPNSTVTGIDIKDYRKPEYISNQIKYIFEDVKNVTLNSLYDIIIDDGSHFLHDVEYVVTNFTKYLKPNGVMVIEDAQQPDRWVKFIRSILDHSYRVSTRDLRVETGTGDNFLIVIEK